MSGSEQQSKKIDLRTQVRNVLMEAWDSLNARDALAVQDKYESYVGRVGVMVLDEAVTRETIAAYLFDLAARATASAQPVALADRCNQAAATLVGLRPQFAQSRDATEVAWCRHVAGLAIDALVMAKIVPREMFDRAVDIAMEEILVRLALHDRPPEPEAVDTAGATYPGVAAKVTNG